MGEYKPGCGCECEEPKVPDAIVYGRYENLTTDQLMDHHNDIAAELRRRLEALDVHELRAGPGSD